jgi:hypothetical protein
MVAITGLVWTSGLSDAGCVCADGTSVALAIANLHHWIYAKGSGSAFLRNVVDGGCKLSYDPC